MIPVLVDTGFLVALYDATERYHRECLQFHMESTRRLVTCEAVVVEAMHMLRRFPTARREILTGIGRRAMRVQFRLEEHPAAIFHLMEKYADTPADLADACLIHMADELNTGDILTLDSDFLHYRWRKTRRFNLLMPLG